MSDVVKAEQTILGQAPISDSSFKSEAIQPLTETAPQTSAPQGEEVTPPQAPATTPHDESEQASIQKARAQERTRYEGMIRDRDSKIAKLEESLNGIIAAQEALKQKDTPPAPTGRFSKIADPDLRQAFLELEARAQVAEETVLNLSNLTVKDEAVRKYGGKVIKEMISGDTPQAIMESAQAAHEAYLSYFTPAPPPTAPVQTPITPVKQVAPPQGEVSSQQASVPNATSAGALSSAGPGPRVTVGNTNASSAIDKLRGLSGPDRMKYFEQYRTDLLQQATADFERNNRNNPILT